MVCVCVCVSHIYTYMCSYTIVSSQIMFLRHVILGLHFNIIDTSAIAHKLLVI